MTIEIYLHEDEKARQTYQINVLAYERANAEELQVLKKIDYTLANWLSDVEKKEKIQGRLNN